MMPSNQGYGINYSHERVSSGQITNIIAFFSTALKSSCEKGILPVVCVHYSVHRGEVPCDHSHDVLDHTVQVIPLVLTLSLWTWDFTVQGLP